MSTRDLAIATWILVLTAGAGAAYAETPHLGRPISQVDLAQWDINILPDGRNLPAGSGIAADGAKIFIDKKSLLYLNGTVLDYDTSLISRGFVFNNPNAKSTCGCGSSFGA